MDEDLKLILRLSLKHFESLGEGYYQYGIKKLVHRLRGYISLFFFQYSFIGFKLKILTNIYLELITDPADLLIFNKSFNHFNYILIESIR